jgi:hypothetical protein
MRSLVILSLFLAASIAHGQCANGNCGGSTPVFVQPMIPLARAAPAYGWYSWPGDSTHLYLYYGGPNGQQVGGYDITHDLYRPLVDRANNIWADACEPPAPLPAQYRQQHRRNTASDAVPNFGVYRDREAVGDDRIRLTTPAGTRDVSKGEAMKLVKDGIPDDANKPRLTIVGSEAERSQVLKDLDGFAALKAAVNLWPVPPDHWSLFSNTTGKPMFVVAGHPTIYVQRPDGSVLHRQDNYGGPQDLQAIAELVSGKQQPIQAVRDNEGKYDPARDPDLRNPVLRAVSDPAATACLGVGSLLLMGLGLVGRSHGHW